MVYVGIAALLAGMAAMLMFFTAGTSTEQVIEPDRTRTMSRELLAFLEKADDAYILTHETMEIRFFSPYATNAVCHEVMEAIYQKPRKMFGTRKFRRRSWSIVDRQGEAVVVRKEIVHKPLAMKKGFHVTLGDNLVELWTVSYSAHGYIVTQVT